MSDVIAGRTRLHYRAGGAGEAVVLIHGFGRTLQDWAPQHELLEDRFRVLSLDLPGFGDSESLAETTLRGVAKAVLAFVDALGIEEPVHLAGNSMGGAVAMAVAVEAPERVRSLVLANSAGFSDDASPLLRLLAIRPVAGVLMRNSTLALARQSERAAFHDPSFATEERINHNYAAGRRPHTVEAMLDLSRELGSIRGPRPEWRHRLLAGLAELNLPTFVLWGDKDRVLSPSNLDAARLALPNIRTHMFADTGHMPMIERADEFAELVGTFWAEVGSQARL